MDIESLMASVKAKRDAAGLKSTYVGADGKAFDMFHPNQASKAFNDFKYELRAKYPTKEQVPVSDMARLKALDLAARKATA